MVRRERRPRAERDVSFVAAQREAVTIRASLWRRWRGNAGATGGAAGWLLAIATGPGGALLAE